MRGRKSLFDQVFKQSEKVLRHKGRDAQLINKRNQLLICRYLFYGSLNPRLSYDCIINQLSNEFFLSPVTIPEIIKANHEQLIKLRGEDLTNGDMRKMWPFLEWDYKRLFN